MLNGAFCWAGGACARSGARAVSTASEPYRRAARLTPSVPHSPFGHRADITSVYCNAEGGSKKEGKKKSKQKAESHGRQKYEKTSSASIKTEKESSKRSPKDVTKQEASPENSRNASPRYHDASMDDASDAGSLFRVTGAGGGGGGGVGIGGGVGGGKNELVARGGSGGALALSRAPVGGSASPAPAPLPQPAPSPAPAALPPPALPPPTFRADTPHRNNGAHIPALDGQAATQIPARPVGAAGPDTPERPASNNKLQPGARAAADSPTPAPPAPPAPSPLFPTHTAYQSHAAAALPDYRHTNHETRTEPQQPEQPHAPLDLHAHHPAPRPPHLPPTVTPTTHPSLPNRVPHSQPHPVIPGHDVRNASPAQPQVHSSVPTSFPNRIVSNGVPQSIASLAPPASTPSSLPSQISSCRPVSPVAPISRPYPTPSIGSSHVNSSISSSIHSHSIPYPGQSSLQKHSVQPMYASRPSHHTAFSVANHISANHLPTSTSNPPAAMHFSHPLSHSIMSHANIPMSGSNPLATSTPNHISSSPHLSSTTTTSTISSFTPSIKHPGLSLPPHPASLAPAVSLHQPMNIDPTPIPTAPTVLTPASSSSSVNSHSLVPPMVDSRQLPTSAIEIPTRSESATVSSAMVTNGYPPPAVYSAGSYPALYAPYAPTLQHSPYLPPSAASPRNTADTRTSLSASPLVAPKTPKGVRPHTPGSLGAAGAHAPLSYSPRGHSPSRERESFSNISSLSRSTAASGGTSAAPTVSSALTAPMAAPLVAPLAGPLPAPLPGPVPTLGVPSTLGPLSTGLSSLTGLAAPTPTAPTPAAPHLAHSLAPVPTVPSISSSAKPPAHWGVTRPTGAERTGFAPAPPLFGAPLPPPNPNPFSAESLFQTTYQNTAGTTPLFPGCRIRQLREYNKELVVANSVLLPSTEITNPPLGEAFSQTVDCNSTTTN
ncbi:jg16624 [Pararge aegeria aegeria]|uniref:Jg16624 protein n=1 Tax=Pararge aegeria aegeria TaxID=348720 RepID=A0A8S4RBF9_9NEOP|nr:jg16624 [Pararge aegeria aegeria]